METPEVHTDNSQSKKFGLFYSFICLLVLVITGTVIYFSNTKSDFETVEDKVVDKIEQSISPNFDQNSKDRLLITGLKIDEMGLVAPSILSLGVFDVNSRQFIAYREVEISLDKFKVGDVPPEEDDGEYDPIYTLFSSSSQQLYFTPGFSCMVECTPRIFKVDMSDLSDPIEVFDHRSGDNTFPLDMYLVYKIDADSSYVSPYARHYGSHSVAPNKKFSIICPSGEGCAVYDQRSELPKAPKLLPFIYEVGIWSKDSKKIFYPKQDNQGKWEIRSFDINSEEDRQVFLSSSSDPISLYDVSFSERYIYGYNVLYDLSSGEAIPLSEYMDSSKFPGGVIASYWINYK